MKQATGKTNASESQTQVSIQLKLGGHSFSADHLPAGVAERDEPVKFVVLTSKTLLIPRDEFDPSLASTYLQLAGMACTPAETPVWSDADATVVAIMAADAACIASLRQMLGAYAVFTTPLLFPHPASVPTIWLYRSGSLCYIKVYAPTLRLAEVFETATETDVIYWLEKLSRKFPFSSFTAFVSGENPMITIKSIKSYFSRIVCE